MKTTFVRKIKSKWKRKMFPEPTGKYKTDEHEYDYEQESLHPLEPTRLEP